MQATESSEDTSPLTQSSVSIFRVTIQTVLKKPNSTAYILETLRWIISSAKGQLFAVEFLKIANESLAMKKSRDTIDLDGELRKSVSEFIKRIEFASENNLDMTSQVMRFYHLTGQEELSLSSFSALVQRQSESLEVEVKMFNMVCQWINILKQDIMPLVKHLKRGWDLLAKDRGVITGFESLLHTSTDTEQAVVMGSIMSQFECHSVDVSDLLLMVLYLFKSDNIQGIMILQRLASSQLINQIVGKLLPGYRINEPLNHLFTCIRIDKRFETLQAILELLVSLSVNKVC